MGEPTKPHVLLPRDLNMDYYGIWQRENIADQASQGWKPLPPQSRQAGPHLHLPGA